MESQLEIVNNNNKLYVEEGKLILDESGNWIGYEEACIVNISSKSLLELYFIR